DHDVVAGFVGDHVQATLRIGHHLVTVHDRGCAGIEVPPAHFHTVAVVCVADHRVGQPWPGRADVEAIAGHERTGSSHEGGPPEEVTAGEATLVHGDCESEEGLERGRSVLWGRRPTGSTSRGAER